MSGDGSPPRRRKHGSPLRVKVRRRGSASSFTLAASILSCSAVSSLHVPVNDHFSVHGTGLTRHDFRVGRNDFRLARPGRVSGRRNVDKGRFVGRHAISVGSRNSEVLCCT